MFRLQIKAQELTIWLAPDPMDTKVFSEAMQVADRMAKACHRTATANCSSTKAWVVEIVGDAGKIFYRSPVAWA